MKVICPKCNTVYNIPSDKIPKTRVGATCKKCGEQIMIEPGLATQPEPHAGPPIPTAPQPAPSSVPQADGAKTRQAFQELNFTELKKVRNYSDTIGALGVLWSIGAAQCAGAVMLVAFDSSMFEGIGERVFVFIFCLLFAIAFCLAAIGTFSRPQWGRGVGIVLCCLGLLGFPIGTIISIYGLNAFIKGKTLFGKNRYRHKDLNKEYKFRKKNRII